MSLLAAAALTTVALVSAGGNAGGAVLGMDVSRFDGRINWQRVADSGIEFAFVQASRGNGHDCTVKPLRCGRDKFYDSNYRRARAAGVRVGPYHRAFVGGGTIEAVRRDARHESLLFVREVGGLRRGDLRPVLDVEVPFAGLEPHALRAWIHTWLDLVRRRLGLRPMIYTNTSSWQATGDTRWFARAGHRLWVANWEVASPSVPAGNWDGRGWSVWQYTSSGHVPGVAGTVDRDRLGAGFGAISVR